MKNDKATSNDVYEPESRIASTREVYSAKIPNGGKKSSFSSKLRHFFTNLTTTQITVLILGLLLAIGLIAVFYYLYDNALNSANAIKQSAIISSDEDKSWEIKVVNQTSGLDVSSEVATSNVTGAPGIQVDNRIVKETVQLLKDAQQANPGETVGLAAGYTSVLDYENAFKTRLDYLMDEEGYSEAKATDIALTEMMQPGTDEHSTGLLINFSVNGSIDPSVIENSSTYNWLKSNAYKYGYIARYPAGAEGITLHGYDPSAFRYVGKDAAEKITAQGTTLEEYAAKVNQEKAAQAAAEAQAQADAQAQQAAAEAQAQADAQAQQAAAEAQAQADAQAQQAAQAQADAEAQQAAEAEAQEQTQTLP